MFNDNYSGGDSIHYLVIELTHGKPIKEVYRSSTDSFFFPLRALWLQWVDTTKSHGIRCRGEVDFLYPEMKVAWNKVFI